MKWRRAAAASSVAYSEKRGVSGMRITGIKRGGVTQHRRRGAAASIKTKACHGIMAAALAGIKRKATAAAVALASAKSAKWHRGNNVTIYSQHA